MKKIAIARLGLFICILILAQSNSTAQISLTGKIKLTTGQKIVIESSITLEASLSMGMELSSNSTTENSLEVKTTTNKNYTISNTLTKVKVNMDMMGQATNYDSEKKEDNNNDIAKTFEEKLNKPVDIIIDNITGEAINDKKKEMKEDTDDGNPMQGMVAMFSENSDDAIVSGAFELIPAGKIIGDNWADTLIAKEMKTIRTYTLKSVTENEAVIQISAISNGTNKIDMQGMEMEFKSDTKTSGEIITNIITGQVKKRTAQSDITGSFQIMGQDMPVTAKTNTTSIYK